MGRSSATGTQVPEQVCDRSSPGFPSTALGPNCVGRARCRGGLPIALCGAAQRHIGSPPGRRRSFAIGSADLSTTRLHRESSSKPRVLEPEYRQMLTQ